MEDLVSIIVPNYNGEAFIAETLQSIQAQTHRNWEALVIDDCSTDNSPAIVEDFARKDPRFRLLKNEVNRGAAYSRNVGLKESKGKWIAFLDGDDTWTKEKLEKQIRFMRERECSFSYAYYERMDEESKPLGEVIKGPKVIGKAKIFRYNYIGCLTVMYEREKIGLIQIDESLRSRNDYAIWLKACKKATCYLLPEVLGSYRVRKTSLSHGSFKKSLKNQYRLFRVSEGLNPFRACWCVAGNLFFGFWKKIFYKKKVPCTR